jgi:hypothetical protein
MDAPSSPGAPDELRLVNRVYLAAKLGTRASRERSAGLVFDLSYFYAMVADFHTRVRCLFSKPRYSVLMSANPIGLEQRGEYDSASRGTRNSRSKSEHQNV